MQCGAPPKKRTDAQEGAGRARLAAQVLVPGLGAEELLDLGDLGEGAPRARRARVQGREAPLRALLREDLPPREKDVFWRAFLLRAGFFLLAIFFWRVFSFVAFFLWFGVHLCFHEERFS